MIRISGLVVLSVVLLQTCCDATDFYISLSGNDANSGKSPQESWSTLARLHTASTSGELHGGDACYLRKGDTWLLDAVFNISLPTPFTLSAYTDSAHPHLERPLIARRAPATDVGALFIVHGSQGGLAVRGVAFSGGESGLAITWYPLAAATVKDFSITDCSFANHIGNAASYNASTGDWWGVAVAIARAVTPLALESLVVSNVTISNNIVTKSDVFYANSLTLTTYDRAHWTRAYVDGIAIHENAIIDCYMNVVFLDTSRDISVAGNVFLRDSPGRLFLFGTTDIIVGSLDSSCTFINNEFGYRGEYQPGGPDGCAFDMETNPNGILLQGNYFHHSFGAGIMIFGHGVGPSHVRVLDNILLWCGCNQTRDDHGGIAFMIANNNASGIVEGNTILSCPGTPAFYVNQPHAADGFVLANNTVDSGAQGIVRVVATPVLALRRFQPGQPSVVTAACSTPGAVLRYTLDGARPSPASPLWPGGSGGSLAIPARTQAVFVKAFSATPGVVESPTEGLLVTPTA